MSRFIPETYKEAYSILAWLFREFIDHKARRYYRAVLLWIFAIKILEVIIPWCFGLIIVAAVSHTSFVPAFLGFCIAHALRLYADWRGGCARELFIGQAFLGLDTEITRQYLEKDIGTHMKEHKALSKSVLEKGRQRADTLIHLLTFWMADSVLLLVVVLPILAVISPVVCVTIVIAIVIGILASSYSNRHVMARADIVDEEHRENMARRDDRINAIERMMTAAEEAAEAESFTHRYREVLSHDRPVWLGFIGSSAGRNAFLTAALLLIVWITATKTQHDAMTVSTFASIGTWVAVAIAQVNNLSQMERQTLWSVAPLKALRAALEIPSAITNKDEGIIIGDEPITVEFRNVSFGYGDGPLVLKNFSLVIKPGEKVALIGQSGSGKSTIGKLLLRYWDPTEGAILVNGHDLRTLNLRAWRKRVSQINQRTQLFTMNLRENLWYGVCKKERARITDEGLLSMMHRFRVNFGNGRLKHGLDTQIGGKNGEEISGGEAQRLLILAAVLRNPGFMVIDEATSALDAESQEAVQSALYEALQEGAGAILIAHRLSTTRGCDRFVMMRPVTDESEGQIEAIAHSMEELALASPTFRKLAKKEGVLLGD